MLKTMAVAGAGAFLASCRGPGSGLRGKVGETTMIKLAKLDTLQYEAQSEKLNKAVRHKLLSVTGNDGTVGIGDRTIPAEAMEQVAQSLADVNLADHESVWKAMMEAGIDDNVAWVVDMACWDLHGRVASQPMAKLLGQKRDRFKIYGDQRLHWYGGNVDRFAEACADAAHNYSENHGIKLHFPGCYRGKAYGRMHDPLPLETALEVLRKVREKVGPDTALAWDPEPHEAATDNLEDARRILEVMDKCNWMWIESPLPASPEEERMKEWLTLRKEFKLHFELEYPPSWAKTIDQQVEARIRWTEAGAVNHWNWESLRRGITPWLRLREWIQKHPDRGVRLNQHCQWAPHLHMAASLTDEQQPMQEYCGCPPKHLKGGYKNSRHIREPAVHEGWVEAPTQPGLFQPDWEFIEKHSV